MATVCAFCIRGVAALLFLWGLRPLIAIVAVIVAIPAAGGEP